MSKEKPSKTEDEYFAKEEAEKKKRLERSYKEEHLQKERANVQEVCYMKCPKCGGDLSVLMFRGIEIDKCKDCSGVWLDNGELEKLAGADESNVIRDILSMFK